MENFYLSFDLILFVLCFTFRLPILKHIFRIERRATKKWRTRAKKLPKQFLYNIFLLFNDNLLTVFEILFSLFHMEDVGVFRTSIQMQNTCMHNKYSVFLLSKKLGTFFFFLLCWLQLLYFWLRYCVLCFRPMLTFFTYPPLSTTLKPFSLLYRQPNESFKTTFSIFFFVAHFLFTILGVCVCVSVQRNTNKKIILKSLRWRRWCIRCKTKRTNASNINSIAYTQRQTVRVTIEKKGYFHERKKTKKFRELGDIYYENCLSSIILLIIFFIEKFCFVFLGRLAGIEIEIVAFYSSTLMRLNWSKQ